MQIVKMSILNQDKAASSEFERAASDFLNELNNIHSLTLNIPTNKIEGTRGDLPTWANIIMAQSLFRGAN